MIKTRKRLTLNKETIRTLRNETLIRAIGGVDTNSGPIDRCLPASPYNTCTGCTIGSAPGNCGSDPCGTGTFDTCTLVTF